MLSNKVFTVIDLDSGFGNNYLAFQKSGFEVIKAFEKDKESCEISKRVFSGIPVEEQYKNDYVPEADVLLGNYYKAFSDTKQATDNIKPFDAIMKTMPKVFLFRTGMSALHSKIYGVFPLEIQKKILHKL